MDGEGEAGATGTEGQGDAGAGAAAGAQEGQGAQGGNGAAAEGQATGIAGGAGSDAGSEGGQSDGAAGSAAASGDAGQQGEGQGTSGEGEGEGDGVSPLHGVPEAGYGEWTMPEGSTPDAELTAIAREGFAALDLSQEGSQQAIDLFTKVQGHQIAVMDKQVQEMHERTIGEYQEKISKDPDYGGDQLQASQELVKATTDYAFKDDPYDTLKWLSDTGNEFHPGLRRAFARLGKLLADDTLDGGNGRGDAQPDTRSIQERMYPKLASQ